MSNFLRHAVFVCVFASPISLFAQQSTSPPQAADLLALKAEVVTVVDKMQKLTQQIIDQIYSFSELGFQEFETSRYVTGILAKKGFQIERGVAGIPTAWIATYGSGHQSAAVGKREFRLFLACKL